MGLLKCSECGNKVSEYAECCQVCGCPISIIKQGETRINQCAINGVHFDFSKVKQLIDKNEKVEAMKEIVNICNMDILDAKLVVDVIIFNSKEIPADYDEVLERFRNKNQAMAQRMNANKVSCPYCHSTNVKKIGAVGRLVSVGTLGLAGSKISKQWHCNGCKSDF